MRKITKSKLEKQIQEEYELAIDFCSYDHFRYYQMMLDTDDGSIWSDVFLTVNEWKEYHDDSIKYLDATNYCNKVSGYVDHAVELLRTAGWEVTE